MMTIERAFYHVRELLKLLLIVIAVAATGTVTVCVVIRWFMPFG